ncbi:maleylpyruvate isomerase N-terminal domain-containing protein [Streptomyces sp. SR-10]|uniref:maleylpyruvate isomerase N-terminal domain-containing protein n=1 Tax=Streptomyces sp. SR-10 TaxID=3416442 RepID=UPI003CE7BE5C
MSEEGRLLAAAAERAGTGASVPTCPGWQIRHLLRHTGMVHRWAAALVAEGHTTYRPAGTEPALDGAELLDRFREGHRHLVRTLEEAPADLDCWTFMPAPSPLAFWSRRQLHETTVHRVDAESALGTPLTRCPRTGRSTASTNSSSGSTPGPRARCARRSPACCGYGPWTQRRPGRSGSPRIRPGPCGRRPGPSRATTSTAS